jgi:hypothetical protein
MRSVLSAIALAMATGLCRQSQGQESDALLEKLKQGINSTEKKLVNLRVEGVCYAERLNEETRQWELALNDSVTAWYDGQPRGKRRIDHHKTVSPWRNGAAPFLEETFSVAYNGRITQTLWTKSGPPKNPSTLLHGDITKGMDWAFMGEFATGWQYSLYGAFEESGDLSGVFRLRKDMLQVREVMFNGVACIKLQVVLTNGISVIACYFDPARAYALLGYERGRGDGILVQKRFVESLLEPVPGIYYPSKARTERMSDDGTLREWEDYQASEVVVNDPNFSDELFTIKWPPKTRVRDLITTNSSVVSGDEQPERVINEKAQEPVRIPIASAPSGKTRIWILVAEIGIVIVVAVALVIHSGKRK